MTVVMENGVEVGDEMRYGPWNRWLGLLYPFLVLKNYYYLFDFHLEPERGKKHDVFAGVRRDAQQLGPLLN